MFLVTTKLVSNSVNLRFFLSEFMAKLKNIGLLIYVIIMFIVCFTVTYKFDECIFVQDLTTSLLILHYI